MPLSLQNVCLTTMLWACLICASATRCPAAELPAKAQRVVDHGRYVHSTWGLLAVDAASGEVLYELNADRLFGSASTAKLFAAASALEVLGADHQFTTHVRRRGDVREGELLGDLILVASGDMSLGGRTTKDGRVAYTNSDHIDADVLPDVVLTGTDPLAGLDDLARQIARSGIRHVQGDVIIDDRLYEVCDPAGKGRFVCSPIMVNDNLVDFLITPGKEGERASVEWRPRCLAYQIDAQVVTVAAGAPPAIEIREVGPKRIAVRGSVPVNLEPRPFVRIFVVRQPADFARAIFIEALQGAGTAVAASPLSANAGHRLGSEDSIGKLPSVASITSPPLSEFVRLILKVSHNQGADTLILLMAAAKARRTFAEGMQVHGSALRRMGIDVGDISLCDGEGGVPADLVTPRTVVQLLRHMATRKEFAAFYGSLPILGVDGSLAKAAPPNSPAIGKIHAKTGTTLMEDTINDRCLLTTRGLAGYMTTRSGRELAFAVYVNRVFVNSLEDAMAVIRDVTKVVGAVYEAE